MSKRESTDLMKDGYSIFLKDLDALGYLPEGVLNWISLMGWSYDDRSEFFTLPELVEKFSLERLNPAPAAINFSKLDHFNGLHIRNLTSADLARRIQPFFTTAGYGADEAKLTQIAPIIRERLVTLDDAVDFAGFFFKDQVSVHAADLIGKNMSPQASFEAARRAYAILEGLPEINPETAEAPLRSLAEELGLQAGQLFGILRMAVTGQSVSPPLFESMAIVGKAAVMARIQNAIDLLAGLVS